MTNCTAPGITLDTLPVVQGHWRQKTRYRKPRKPSSIARSNRF
jgi:hypothetical protein